MDKYYFAASTGWSKTGFDSPSGCNPDLGRELKLKAMNLSNVSTEEILKELEKRGCAVRFLWNAHDVTDRYHVSDELALSILNSILSSDSITETINELIMDEAILLNLEEKTY